MAIRGPIPGAWAPIVLRRSARWPCASRSREQVLYPAVEALSRMGCPFQGVLYAGLMIVKGTPYVLEFNARMGDPETQVVLPLLKTDLLEVIEAVVEHRLDQLTVDWHDETAVCVVMTSGGYPGAYQTGRTIHGLPTTVDANTMVFHAGTAQASHRGGDGRRPSAGYHGMWKNPGRRTSGSLSRDQIDYI